MAQSARLSIDEFLLSLQHVKAHGDQWQAQCPAHEDSRASLSVSQGRSGGILVKCFAGCTFSAILNALNLTAGSLSAPKDPPSSQLPRILATYDYKDDRGDLRFQVCRFEPKDFRQRRPNGGGGWLWNMQGITKIPYRLNELLGHTTIYIAEGEKDCDALWKQGLPATTNVGGAGKWRETETLTLKNAGVSRVIVLPDNDGPGRKHAEDIARQMKAAGIACTVVPLPGLSAHGDVSEWFAQGHKLAELEALTSRPFVVPPSGYQEPEDKPDDPHGAGAWVHSDLGAAESLIARYGDHIRFDHKQDRWLVWDKHRWKPDATKEVRRIAHTHVRKWQQEALAIRTHTLKERVLAYTLRLERRGSMENMLYEAHAMLPIADDGTQWDADTGLLGCTNGVVNLWTGELRPGRPEDHVTMTTGIAFDHSAQCPRWLQFLEDVFAGDQEIIAFIKRAVGYSLSGDVREQCFFLCIGSGANGKSTFLSALNDAWGDYSYSTDIRAFASNSASTETTPFDLAELANRRLIFASETKANSRLNEQSLKNFTGGEKMNAQRKYGHPFEYSPVGKLWMGVNHQPRVMDDSFGFWRRVRLIPFTQIFTGSKDNRNLRAELRAEAAGILAWSLVGCLEWQRDGLHPPMQVMNAIEAYQEAENPLTDFILEWTVPDQHASISAAAFFQAYKEYALQQGLSERERLSPHSFGRLMVKKFDRKRGPSGQRYHGVRVVKRAQDLLTDI